MKFKKSLKTKLTKKLHLTMHVQLAYHAETQTQYQLYLELDQQFYQLHAELETQLQEPLYTTFAERYYIID